MTTYFFVPGSTSGYGPGGREIYSFAGSDPVGSYGSPAFETREAADEAARADAAREPEYQTARAAAAAELFRESANWPAIAGLLRKVLQSHREHFTPGGLRFVAECCDGTPLSWGRAKGFITPIADETPLRGTALDHKIGAAMYSSLGEWAAFRRIYDILRAAIYIAPGPRAYWSPRRIRGEVAGLLAELARLVGDPDLPARYGFGLSPERLSRVHRQVFAAR